MTTNQPKIDRTNLPFDRTSTEKTRANHDRGDPRSKTAFFNTLLDRSAVAREFRRAAFGASQR